MNKSQPRVETGKQWCGLQGGCYNFGPSTPLITVPSVLCPNDNLDALFMNLFLKLYVGHGNFTKYRLNNKNCVRRLISNREISTIFNAHFAH